VSIPAKAESVPAIAMCISFLTDCVGRVLGPPPPLPLDDYEADTVYPRRKGGGVGHTHLNLKGVGTSDRRYPLDFRIDFRYHRPSCDLRLTQIYPETEP